MNDTGFLLFCVVLFYRVLGETIDGIAKCRGRYGMAFLVFSVSNLILAMFASMITAFIAPAAAGSGIPEVKAYLNGVDAPGIFSLRTLVVKVGSFSVSRIVIEYFGFFGWFVFLSEKTGGMGLLFSANEKN